jgi:small-conductance mechanosensitive channel
LDKVKKFIVRENRQLKISKDKFVVSTVDAANLSFVRRVVRKIQDKMFNILKDYSYLEFAEEEFSVYKTHTLYPNDFKTIRDYIFSQLDQNHIDIFYSRSKRSNYVILLGSADFSELMHEKDKEDCHFPMNFNIDARFNGFEFGIPVCIVPGMSGVFVMDASIVKFEP